MCSLVLRDNGVAVKTKRRAFLALRQRRAVIELFRRTQRKSDAVLAVHADWTCADRVPFAVLVHEHVRCVFLRAAHLRDDKVVEREDFADAVKVAFRALDGPFARPVHGVFPAKTFQLILQPVVHLSSIVIFRHPTCGISSCTHLKNSGRPFSESFARRQT